MAAWDAVLNVGHTESAGRFVMHVLRACVSVRAWCVHGVCGCVGVEGERCSCLRVGLYMRARERH